MYHPSIIIRRHTPCHKTKCSNAAAHYGSRRIQRTYLVAALASLDVNNLAHDAEKLPLIDCGGRRGGKDKGNGVSISAEEVWSFLLFGTTALP